MMRNNDLASLSVQRYQEVIDGVVGRVRGEFNQEGIDESVLDEVRALWEAKLVATGVIGEPSNEGQQVIQQQLRVGLPPGVAAMPYAAAAALQQQQLLALRQQHLAAAAAAGGAPGALPVGMPPHLLAQGAGGQPINMAALQMIQAQAAQAAQAQAQVAQAQAQAAALAAEQKRKLEAGMAEYREAKQQRTIPQQDGPADDAGEEGGGAAEEGGTVAEDDDDDPLTEDEDGSGDEVDEAAVANVVLGQFEKVQRSKSKWKIVLKDCILTLDNRDYLCRKVTGEMDFS